MGDTFREDVKPPGHALEGNVTDERTREVCGRDAGGGGDLLEPVRALWNQPKARLQVEAKVRSRRCGGTGGPVTRSAFTSARCFVGRRGVTGYGAEEAPAVGAAQASGSGSASAPPNHAAIREHGRCDLQAARAGWETAEDYGPNRVWCADFKGNFAVGGERCNPLTISDGFSRYLLTCKALRSTTCSPVKRSFEATFREFGVPDAIRTDNGPPFSTLAVGGLSQLAIWWIRLGIRPERIMPGRPDQNGRHERMHRTLKAETARPPASSMRAQQARFDRFREEYNNVRPHEALGQATPSSLYRPTLRPLPRVLPELDYPGHFTICRTYPNGVITWRGTQWYLSGCLRNELVGLDELDNDCWRVFFGPVLLGILDVKRHHELRNSRRFGVLVPADGALRRKRRRRRLYGR